MQYNVDSCRISLRVFDAFIFVRANRDDCSVICIDNSNINTIVVKPMFKVSCIDCVDEWIEHRTLGAAVFEVRERRSDSKFPMRTNCVLSDRSERSQLHVISLPPSNCSFLIIILGTTQSKAADISDAATTAVRPFALLRLIGLPVHRVLIALSEMIGIRVES